MFVKQQYACLLSQTLFDTCMEMNKLEKLEFGGMKGRSLSEQVAILHHEFTELWKVFKESSYDCFDQTEQVGLQHAFGIFNLQSTFMCFGCIVAPSYCNIEALRSLCPTPITEQKLTDYESGFFVTGSQRKYTKGEKFCSNLVKLARI